MVDKLEDLCGKFSSLTSSYKKIIVAYSGGLDSHVLLHLLVNSSIAKSKITALHVNHNISPNSKKWATHCQRVCEKLKVKYVTRDLEVTDFSKKSKEEVLRNLRYEIFADVLPKGAALLTAHHADDQAETLLLQLFRGGGPKGLAGMPEKIKFAKGYLMRPLLGFSRCDLEQYAKKHKLKWIDDESNFDTKFDRNFIRHKLMPKIQKNWPGAVTALNRSASHCAEAAELLEVLAEKDLEEVALHCHPRVDGDPEKMIINITPLKKLSLTRQKNVIRFWLGKPNLPLPSETKLNEIIRTVVNSRYDRMPVVEWKGAEVRRFRNNLYAMPPLAPHDNKQVLFFSGKSLKLPGGLGALKIKTSSSSPPKIRGDKLSGNPVEFKLNPKKLEVRFRQGGEKIKLPGRRGTHDLKKLMQEWDIPPWQRDRIPIVYYDEKIVAVVGYYGILHP